MEGRLRVLVTGASGFIGSHLVRALIDFGHDVLSLVFPNANLIRLDDIKDKIKILKGDLRRASDFKRELQNWRPDSCVHLAWYAEPGKYLDSYENLHSLQGSLELLQALALHGCEHFIGAGTCAEYEKKSTQLFESDKTRPETLYAASKLSFQMIGEQIAEQSKMGFTWGRIFGLYGSHEDPRRLVPSAILKLQRNEIFTSSAGEQVRDYLHVTDVANAILALVNQQSTGIFNICSSEPLSVKTLLNTIGSLMGKSELIAYGSLPYRRWEPSVLYGDNSRLKAIGWSPHIDLVEGMQTTINWWKYHAETKQ